MIRTKSIHRQIFLRYSILVIGIITVFLTFFSIYMSGILRNEATRSMLQSTTNLSSTLDSKLNDMNSTALKIASSTSIKNAFFQDISVPKVLFNTRNDLASSLSNLFLSDMYELDLCRHDGFFFKYNINSYDTKSDEKNSYMSYDWAKKTLDLGGKRYISPTRMDDPGNPQVPVISLSMAFSQYYITNPKDIIEIKQLYQNFSNIISQATDIQSQTGRQSFVIDSSGAIIYPFGDAVAASQAVKYLQKINALNASSGSLVVSEPSSNRKYICTYAKSEFSGWTVITIESELALYRPIYVFILNITLLGIPVLIVTLLLSYYISKALTAPIKKLKDYINDLNLNTLIPKQQAPLNSQVDELQELNDTFFDMCKRLDESLDEVVSAHSHEIQSRMLALQSQMNPHFLYNSLSAIGIMCEDKRTDEAMKYCHGLSNMLRYISTNSFHPVELDEEIKHTQDYMYLTKQRYEDMIDFRLDVPESMLSLNVPKLVVQPLVENCVKYGLGIELPWRIKVIGRLLSENWIISVSDNGVGFSVEKLEELKGKFDLIDLNKSIQEIPLGGMGLVNIYVRLKLYYGANAIFDIKNEPCGGATVTIGGSVDGVAIPC